MKFDYKFEPLEELLFDESNQEDGYDGHYELDLNKIKQLGEDGFELFQIILIDNVQHGWFKKIIDD